MKNESISVTDIQLQHYTYLCNRRNGHIIPYETIGFSRNVPNNILMDTTTSARSNQGHIMLFYMYARVGRFLTDMVKTYGLNRFKLSRPSRLMEYCQKLDNRS